MSAKKKINVIAENALSQIDSLGFHLDSMGVENQINRHTIIAAVMFGQKRLEGEMDSLNARIDIGKSKVEGIIGNAEKLAVSAANLAVFPARYTYDRVRAQF